MNTKRDNFEGFLVKTVKGSKPVKSALAAGEKPYFVMVFVKSDEIGEVRKIEYSFDNDGEAVSFKNNLNKSYHDESHRLKLDVSYTLTPESIETSIYRGETLAVLNGHQPNTPQKEILFPYKSQ